MRIAFVNPPFKPRFSRESRSAAVSKGGTLYYPHWLAIAAAYSRHRGHTIDLFDGCATPMSHEAAAERVEKFGADIAILDTSTPSVYNDLRLADRIKRRNPSVRVFLVGPHVSATADATFAYAAKHDLQLDGVLLGEYDGIITELAARIADGVDLTDTPGLASLRADGTVRQNPRPAPLHDLDGWPLVSALYKEFLDIPAYYYSHTKHPMVTIITGRGCPYRCTFCQLPQVMYGHDYRRRSIEDVVREFRHLHEQMPEIRGIMIEDDTFTADKPRTRELCRRLVEEGLNKIPWTCNARADVDLETLTWMKRAGARMMCVGFESGDQVTLNHMRKGTKLTIIEQFVKDARTSGVMVHGCFMFGNRHETPESMNQTLGFALSLPIDTAQFFPIMVSPGTADYEHFQQAGMLRSETFSDWNDDEGNHQSTIVRPELSNRDIEAFCDLARRKFYLRPGYVAYKAWQSLRDPEELRRNWLSLKPLARHLWRRPGSTPTAAAAKPTAVEG